MKDKDTFAIDPDASVGKLILPERAEQSLFRSGGIVPLAMVLDVATLGMGPLFFTAFELIGRTVADVRYVHEAIHVRSIENPVDHSRIRYAVTRRPSKNGG